MLETTKGASVSMAMSSDAENPSDMLTNGAYSDKYPLVKHATKSSEDRMTPRIVTNGSTISTAVETNYRVNMETSTEEINSSDRSLYGRVLEDKRVRLGRKMSASNKPRFKVSRHKNRSKVRWY